MVRIASIEPLEGLRVRLRFTDGTKRELDLTPYLRAPVFETLKQDPAIFRAVRLAGQASCGGKSVAALVQPSTRCR
jgi:hypothetical protein